MIPETKYSNIMDSDLPEKNVVPANTGGSGPIFIISALVLFVAAILVRNSVSNQSLQFFISPFSGAASGQMLFHDYPPNGESVVFREVMSLLAKDFFRIYILPMLIFLGACYCAVRGFAGKISLDKCLEYAGKNPAKTALMLFVVTVAIYVPLQRWVINDYYTSSDEFSYILQSKILLQGKLYLDSPEPHEAFQATHVINNGKWYSKYTIGWPLLLAVGIPINMPWLINCLLAGLTVAVMFCLGREVYDIRTGLVASLMLLFCPMFTMNAMTLYPHTSHLLFILLFALFFFKSLKSRSAWYNCLISGFSLGMALLIRPAGTALCSVVFFIYGIYLLIAKKNGRGNLLKKYLLITAAFLVILGITLAVNKSQTGNALKFGFNIYDQSEKWGLGSYGHNYFRALWNTCTSTSRLVIWIVIFTLEAAVISLWERKRENRFFFALVATVITFYFFYYSLGVIEYGPRYYFVMLGFLVLLGARGITLIGDRLSEKIPGSKPVPVMAACMLLFALFAEYPAITKGAIQYTRSNSMYVVDNLVQSLTPAGKKILVFVRSNPYYSSFVYTLNLPGFEKSREVRALYLDPETNDKVREKFPGRLKYILDFDFQSGRYILRPDYEKPFRDREKNVQVDDLIYAAYNYARSLRDRDGALAMMDSAAKIAPGDINVLIRRASILMDMERFDEALPVFESLVREHPDLGSAYFALGICYVKMNRNEEARKAFEKFMQYSEQASPIRVKARFWIDYLSKDKK